MNKKEMESELGFLVSVLIICADITAAVLGIEAEIAQSKVSNLYTNSTNEFIYISCVC